MSKRTLRAGTVLQFAGIPVRLESDAEIFSETFASDNAFAEHLAQAGALDLHRADLEGEVERDGKRFNRTFGFNAVEVLEAIPEAEEADTTGL